MVSLEITSCIRGFHEYCENWNAVVGETMECKREIDNIKDRYAVAVIKNEEIVGHLPRNISRVCSLFLHRRGHHWDYNRVS